MSNRIEKVNSLLEQEISKIILRDFYFPEVLVTLTRVDSFANLIGAKVYISVFPDKDIDKIVDILNKGAYSIQQKINKILKMRPVPKIEFVKDKELIKANKVQELLNSIKQEESN
ncbi:MAG: 30S ribosome-binding factor RbfA [Patescibacteria group bacterium]